MDEKSANPQVSFRKRFAAQMEKLWDFWQYYRHRIIMILVIISAIVLVAVLLLAKHFDENAVSNADETNTIVNGTTSSVRIEIPFFAQEQYLVGTGVIAYMKSDLSENVETVLGAYRSSSQRMDAGYPVAINFDITGMPAGYQIEGLRVEVSEDTAFNAPRVFPLSVDERSVDVYHLKTGMQYYFRVIVTVSDGSEVFAQGTFRTADTPRILSIDGVYNARDFGGWKTVSGKTVRQGLLYRGSELDANVEEKYQISEEGKDVMLNVLGVKTEMDLRWNVMKDALGDAAEHRRYAVAQYTEIFENEYQESIRMLFSDVADPSIYPAYIHCTNGWNRTGTVITLLGLLLGMSEEDVIREHELSALYHGDSNTESLQEFMDNLSQFGGDTLTEQVENFLISTGVTQEQINSIRNIFLTD